MKIVVLDGFTLNPGDLSWSELEILGECTVYDRTRPDQAPIRSEDAEILLTNKTPLPGNLISQLPKLRYIGVLATGYNVVDTAAARAHNVSVTNVPAYSTSSVAQMTFALLLELDLRVGHHSETVRQGRWSSGPDFAYWDFPLIELDGATLGIVGWGRIGRAVAQIGHAMGMKIIVHSRSRPAALPASIRWVELETVFRESDIVSLHCPLTPETRHMVNAERLGWMKRSAYLLNTSRGPLIDEAALADALGQGRIAGAGLDVLSTEPPSSANPLLHAPNCVITPHMAWATSAARIRLMKIAVENIRAFISGRPQNIVN